MAAAGNIIITGQIDGFAQGSKIVSLTVPFAAAVDQSNALSLASGDNTVAVPAGATAVVIIPPSSNTTITLKLKGAGADTGVVLKKAAPSFVSVDAGANANIIINASGTLAGVTVLFI